MDELWIVFSVLLHPLKKKKTTGDVKVKLYAVLFLRAASGSDNDIYSTFFFFFFTSKAKKAHSGEEKQRGDGARSINPAPAWMGACYFCVLLMTSVKEKEKISLRISSGLKHEELGFMG